MIARKKTQRGFTLIELMIVVAIIGILAVLAVFGVRRYLASAKSAEASNALGAMQRGAVQGYEEETTPSELLTGGGTSSLSVHTLCASATVRVPVVGNIKGVKYLANNKTTAHVDYYADSASTHTGFACLKFEMSEPQMFSYKYVTGTEVLVPAITVPATAAGWESDAQGDLNGDATLSSFGTGGDIVNGRATPLTTIVSADPDE